MRWLRFAARNLLRNRRRSLVAALIAALGTAALLLAGGFALYTYTALEDSAVRDSGHLLIATPQHFDADEDVPLQHGLEDAAALQQQLRQDPAVRHVLPRVEFSGLLGNGEKSVGMTAVGIDAAAESQAKGPFLNFAEGSLPGPGDKGWALVGVELARALKAEPGRQLTLMATGTRGALESAPVRVAGVIRTGVPELDRRLVYTDLGTAQALLRTQRVSVLSVFLQGMADVVPAQERLAARFPALTVRTWEAQAGFYDSVRALYHRIFGMMGAVIGVIVVVVVANAMVSAVIERTRELGTLRALGALPGQLVGALALEGLMLGGLGALLGAMAAVALSLLLRVVPVHMPPPPGHSVGYPLHIHLDAPAVLMTVLSMAVLAALASAWVARRALRQPVVEALAHV